MNRIDRLHAILTHLQSKRKVTAQEIANRFKISLRTVYRDIKALDESGVPVIGEAGTGYTIMEGYRLPPVMFTQEEAVSLMLGSKLAAQFTDKSVQKQFESALFKIKSVLRNIDKEHVDQLNDSIAILGPKPGPDDESAQYLAVLQKTIVDKKIVTIRYQANYSEEITERSIEPIGLCYYGSAWHLIAWCRMRKGYRDFRINRMKTLHVKEELFGSKNHPTLQHFINEMTNNHQTGLQEVTVLFSKKIIKHIGEQRYYHGFVSEEKAGEMYRMKFLTAHPEGMARWLLMFTDGVSLCESPQMLSLMKKLIDDLTQQHI